MLFVAFLKCVVIEIDQSIVILSEVAQERFSDETVISIGKISLFQITSQVDIIFSNFMEIEVT